MVLDLSRPKCLCCLTVNQTSARESAPTATDWLTIEEAAEVLRVHPRTVQRAIAAGRIPHLAISSKTFRIPRSGLLEATRMDGEQEGDDVTDVAPQPAPSGPHDATPPAPESEATE